MTVHKTVLLKEAVDNLNLKEGSVAVDATLGGGGHSCEILKIIGDKGKLIAIDRDIEAINRFKDKNKDKNVVLVKDNFSNIEEILRENKIDKVDAILADFGLSSDQLDSTERGFSFLSSADLDMRMDQSQEVTARDIIRDYSEEELKKIFWEFGEEKYSPSIAKNIIEAREANPIEKTEDLVAIIDKSVPEEYKHKRIHFATRIFQALRIEVNNELESIKKFIEDSVKNLKTQGRLAVISFHSGEDRIVKNIFKDLERECDCPPEFPICQCEKESHIKIITKKPITASEEEIRKNTRSRSAKLRVVEKTPVK